MPAQSLDFIGYIQQHFDHFSQLVVQHVQLTFASVGLGVILAIPLGIVATRVPALAAPMTSIANAGQTIPSIAVLALMLPVLGIGFLPSVAALTIRALLPIFLNTYLGIRAVEAAVVDAAQGMGASGLQRLLLVELPLASPAVYAGIQTAAVQNVGIATIAAFIGGGGLGELIIQGLVMLDPPVLLAGAISVAVLTLFTEVVLRYARRAVVPAGVRGSAA